MDIINDDTFAPGAWSPWRRLPNLLLPSRYQLHMWCNACRGLLCWPGGWPVILLLDLILLLGLVTKVPPLQPPHLQADCQLYHVCSAVGDGVFTKFDFLCPNGTIFNQVWVSLTVFEFNWSLEYFTFEFSYMIISRQNLCVIGGSM